ncbi:MAG TPA: hypothetical protein VJ506_05225 [Candidatus Limnocylindrales bacterium]|nr:hypothetical protein [Candidatus Limnocylindrales bacterium]
MDWVAVGLRFLHVGGGAAWLGASLFANLVIVPFIAGQPADQRPALVERLVLAPEKVIIGGALTAGLSGLILGLAGRGFTSIGALATPAGVVWLAAIAIAIVVFGAGGRITSPAARRLQRPPVSDDDDRGSDQALGRLRTGFRIELAGIASILALMVVLPRV